jgi:hypothetical protein
MKYLLPVLLAASLAAAAPAMADNDHGRGGGGWHGGGHGDGGGRGGGDGGGWRGEGGGNGNGNGNGRGRWGGGGGGPSDGRWGGGYPAAESGPGYGAPPRGRGPETYRGEQDDARRGVRTGQIRSMGEIVGRIGRIRPGRILDGGLEQLPDGRPAYRVIWGATDGRRIDYLVDAQTGAILEGR